MQSDFDRYINNEMNGEERMLFERQLHEDPKMAAEFEEYRNMLDALQTQMLRERIASTIAKGRLADSSEKKSIPQWLWVLSALFLVSIAVIWQLSPIENEEVETPQIESQDEVQLPAETEDSPPVEAPTEFKIEESDESEPPRLIAQNEIPEPTNDFSSVRGLDTGTSEWKSFVESIWVTQFDYNPDKFNPRFSATINLLKTENFTDAFVQLYSIERASPENDTMAYLKGYCFLELKEGAEALSYFEKLPIENSWKASVQWYTILAHLLKGEKQLAIDKAATITSDSNHPFYNQAKALSE